MELPVTRNLIVGNHLDKTADAVVIEKMTPRTVSQRSGADQKGTLPVLGASAQDLAGNERLSETDLIRNHNTAEISKDAPGAPYAVKLERRQWNVACFLPLLLELLTVELPQHTHENQPGRKFLLRLFEKRSEVERNCLTPKVIEPLLSSCKNLRI